MKPWNWRTTIFGAVAGLAYIGSAYKAGHLDAATLTTGLAMILGHAAAQDSRNAR